MKLQFRTKIYMIKSMTKFVLTTHIHFDNNLGYPKCLSSMKQYELVVSLASETSKQMNYQINFFISLQRRTFFSQHNTLYTKIKFNFTLCVLIISKMTQCHSISITKQILISSSFCYHYQPKSRQFSTNPTNKQHSR